MFSLRKILAFCLLSIVSFTSVKADSSHFKLKDLKGTYILGGATAGGPNTQSSASIILLEITDDKGNGTISFLSNRISHGTIPSTTIRLPSAQYPNPISVKASLNADGFGELLAFDFPTVGDITHNDIVLKKHRNKVIKGFMLKTEVIGPSADSDMANEIKLFKIERQ